MFYNKTDVLRDTIPAAALEWDFFLDLGFQSEVSWFSYLWQHLGDRVCVFELYPALS